MLPMGTLLGVAIIPYVVARVQGGAGQVYIAEAFGSAVLVAFVVALAKGLSLRAPSTASSTAARASPSAPSCSAWP
jgi:hypothetical protein